MKSFTFGLTVGVALWVSAFATYAQPPITPSAYGPAAQVDTPVMRVPFTANPPTIDGIMEEGEWENAASLSGFWYDWFLSDFRFMAPFETQLRVYAAYDHENLYIAYVSPVYPQDSWLKARGRFPNTIFHPLYGLIWDDHIELEIRPYHDNQRGFQKGLLKWFVNPIDTVTDQLWSTARGENLSFRSGAQVRSNVDGRYWTLEMRLPLENMRSDGYAGTREDGRPVVEIPPPDGTAYRAWFTRSIGGNGPFFNAFDAHIWNTTKTMLIFDSQAPVFRIDQLGPIMEDTVDLTFTVKNHSTRSETVRVGFFIENVSGTVYSSYEAPELADGLIELRPGEVRQMRLRQAFPGISVNGNTLWFDVRSAGTPAKQLFLTRLIAFHSMDGGSYDGQSFRERRLDVIEKLRPPRQDFDFRHQFSVRNRRLAAVVDTGIHGASEEARSATVARLTVTRADGSALADAQADFIGPWATFELPLEQLAEQEHYGLTLLLFDDTMRVVGERQIDRAITYEVPEWMNTDLGQDDLVWEPFTALVAKEDGFETLKHHFTLADSGLPSQIEIKKDDRVLPLEARGTNLLQGEDLLEHGRGPQLAAPITFEAQLADGSWVDAEVIEPARRVRDWKSEFEYRSRLRAGPVEIDLTTQYDVDGAMHATLHYHGDGAQSVQAFGMRVPVAGPLDLATSAMHGGSTSMTGSDRWECAVPQHEGVVWDNTDIGAAELFYSRLVPWMYFGSADRGFSWICDTDQGMLLDKDGSTVTIERDAQGISTWRVRFVNHETVVPGEPRQIDFTFLTHPSKPKPDNARYIAWHKQGEWGHGHGEKMVGLSEAELIEWGEHIRDALPHSEGETLAEWKPTGPPYFRIYQLRSVFGTPEMDQDFVDYFLHELERNIRIARMHGWWWDETWPTYRSHNVAQGNAYWRDPDVVGDDELPWQEKYLTTHKRTFFKRLARVFKQLDMPQRNYFWSNSAATAFESFGWDAQMVEEAGSDHRSYDIDVVTIFPASLYRYLAQRFTGLIVRLVPGHYHHVVGVMKGAEWPGDDKIMERQLFGRALLNDVGLQPDGPHGIFANREQYVRLVDRLFRFDFFNEMATEMQPYWRQTTVRVGEPGDAIYATVYRQANEQGGYRALIVVMNETNEPREVPIELLDVDALLGGRPTQRSNALRQQADLPEALHGWWEQILGTQADHPALLDFETGEAIVADDEDGRLYSRVHIPRHDYRLLYAEHIP